MYEREIMENTFRKEILVRIMFCLCAFIFSSGIITNYAMYSMRMTPISEREFRFISTIEILMSLSIFFNIFVIFMNCKTNYRFRNLRDKGSPINPLIIYLLCLPLFVLTIIGIIPVIIIDAFTYYCLDPFYNLVDIFYCIAVGLNFFFVVILLVDISGQNDTGEEWFLNFINLLTVVSTLVSLWIQVLYNLQLKSTDTFGLILKRAFNNSFYRSNCTDFIGKKIATFTQFKIESIIMAMIILTPYLILPIQRNLKLLLQNTEIPIPLDMSLSRRQDPILSPIGIIVSCIFLIAYGSSISLYYYKKILPITIFFHIINILLPFLAIIMCFILIKEVRFWGKIPFKKFFHFDNVILYMGITAEFSTTTINILIDIHKYNSYENLLFLVQDILTLGFIVIHATLVSLLFERHPRKPHPTSWNYILSPILFIMVSNATSYLREYFLAFTTVNNHEFQVRLTLIGIIQIARPFIIMYKTHVIIKLAGVYINMYKS